MESIKYIYEGEIINHSNNGEVIGRLRYFFKTDNDVVAKALTQVIKHSLEKGLSSYYGSNCVNNTRLYKLENLPNNLDKKS